MSKGIKLSPKHELNPTQVICVFCGETKELAILGKLKGDAKAPPKVITDYTPCPECKKKMDQGTTLMEVTQTEPTDKRPPIRAGIWLTGRWCVMKPDVAKEIFNTDSNIIMLGEAVYAEVTKLYEKD